MFITWSRIDRGYQFNWQNISSIPTLAKLISAVQPIISATLTLTTIITLSISSGYLVIRCIGFNKKLLIGSPAVRGSDIHCASKSLKACDWVDLFCSSVQAFSWRLHHRMWGFNIGISLTKMSPIFSTHMLLIRSLIMSSLHRKKRITWISTATKRIHMYNLVE